MKKRFSVAVIGEGETEWFYFESLRVAKRYPFKIAPTLAQHADIGHMVKLVEYFVKEEFDHVFCLLDMDRLLRVPKEMQVYQNAKRKSSKCRNTKVMFIETNPCTEFWFLLHFLKDTYRKKSMLEFIRMLSESIAVKERQNVWL